MEQDRRCALCLKDITVKSEYHNDRLGHEFHSECMTKKLTVDTLKKFEALFFLAGYTFSIFNPIVNGYHNCEYDTPWYTVETNVGKIKIGWRKRVINIEWPDRDLSFLFQKENVTQGAHFIHAYGYIKAV